MALIEVQLLRLNAANKQLLYQRQRVFEQGERSGHMLAWLSKEPTNMTHIANIKNESGRLLSDPGEINACFADYYKDLYSSRAGHTLAELQSFLDNIQFPALSDDARAQLEAPITLKEIQRAIFSMQAGKTPGDDGLPAEFFKTHCASLAARLRGVLLTSLEAGTLPPSMMRAVIVVLPKLGKDPELCSSYRPISLLNVDAKILTKVLANRLNAVILSLIHGDQTGFMLGKGTDIYLRRLFTVIDRVAGRGVRR